MFGCTDLPVRPYSNPSHSLGDGSYGDGARHDGEGSMPDQSGGEERTLFEEVFQASGVVTSGMARIAKGVAKRVDKLLGRGVPKSLNLVSPSASDIKALNYKQLQAVLGQLDLPKTGKKGDLVQRLLGHYGLTSEAEGGGDTESTVRADSEEAKASKKRKWTRTDPAKFAPNEYHENLFRANFPLVDIKRIPVGEKFPGIDKFEGETIDRDTKDEIFGAWVDRIFKANGYFRQPVNEKQSVAKHFALLEDLGDFTRIAPHEVQRVTELLGTKRKWEYVDESLQCKGEANQGIEIQYSVDDLVTKKSSKNTGLEIAVENPSMLEGELEDPEEVTGYADAVLHVWDDRVSKRRKLEAGPSYIDTQRAACVVERKFLDDKYKFWAPFQGGYYAVKSAMRNILKGHLQPVYVLVLTDTKWTYGKLEPCGFVALQDGKVDPASMNTFSEHQKLAGEFNYEALQAKLDYETLQAKLDAGTVFYRKNYRDNPAALYRDQTTLVGTFYLSSQWYALPNAEVTHGCNNAGVHRFFDGLMRVIVGDSILAWRKEDFDAVYKRRKHYTRTARDCLKN